MRKASLAQFLARNPFPNHWTDGLFYREKMRAIHRIAPQTLGDGGGPARILEIGGGRTGLAGLLYPEADVVTLDLDVSLHGQGPPGVASAFVCGDARRLPFADATFDAVTLFDVLEHVDDDRCAAGEAMRVARPGGAILVSTPNADWHYPFYRFMRRFCPHERVLMAEWGHVRRGYEAAELATLFGAAPEHRASFINAGTAFYHDVAFSWLPRRVRLALYAAAAPIAAAAYLAHRPGMHGTETAFAWRRAGSAA